MPERDGKFFVADDNLVERKKVKAVITNAGHIIALEASTLEEALTAAPLLEEQGIIAAVIDGNFSAADKSGTDGITLAIAIRSHAPNVKIIGYSADPFPVEARVDIDLTKARTAELPGIISQL